MITYKVNKLIIFLFILSFFIFLISCDDKSNKQSNKIQNNPDLTNKNAPSKDKENEDLFTLSVTKSPPNAPAKVLVNPDKSKFRKGEEVTIYVLTVEDIFMGWEGDLKGAYKDKQGNIQNYPGKITMDSDKNVIARFKPAPDKRK